MNQEFSMNSRKPWTVKTAWFGLLLASVVTSGAAFATATMDPRVEAGINERIKPMGQVSTGNIELAAAGAGKIDGHAAYKTVCFACHDTGAAGSPKLGDKAAWQPRIAKGKPTLYDHALHGFNAMPAKGGSALPDDTIKAIVDYMVSQGQ